MKLPRLPPMLSDAAALGRALRDFASDVVLSLRELPQLEYKTITTAGDMPLLVKTKIANVLEVRRAQSYATLSPGDVVDDTSICWRRSNDPARPGVLVTELGGLRRGTNYTIVLAIQGTD